MKSRRGGIAVEVIVPTEIPRPYGHILGGWSNKVTHVVIIILVWCNLYEGASNISWKKESRVIYLFKVLWRFSILYRFQRVVLLAEQYKQLVTVLYCKLPTIGKQLPSFTHKVRVLTHLPQR